MNNARGGEGVFGFVDEIGGSSGHANKCVTKCVHTLAVSSWP